MDEPQYLHVADFAAHHNWRFPQETNWVFFGKRYPNLAAQTHLPVAEYYLAILIRLLGRFDELKFRLLFSVFPLFAIISFYRLAKRFTRNPLLVSCLFAVCPAFFVLGPTLMMDIPAIAFLLAGLSLYLDGHEKPVRLWLSAICFILAAGTAYTVLVPLGCLFIWAVCTGRPKREWIAIAAAPSAIAAWLMVMTAHFGESPAVELTRYYTSHFSFSHLVLPVFSFIGGVAVFPWMHLAFAEKRVRRVIAITSIVAALALTFFCAWLSTWYRLWFFFLASSGIGLLVLFAVDALRQTAIQKPLGHGFLVLWLPVTLLFFLIFGEMISARYILLVIPPLFLVMFDQIPRNAAASVVVCTGILSVALAVGDYRFVNSYSNWVGQNIVHLQQQGFVAWNASESGLRFYLERDGVQTLDELDLRPKAGDLIIRQASFRYGLSKDLEPVLINIASDDLVDAFPVRTFSRDAGAGFHDSHLGLVPFNISRAPLDRLEIVEVSPFVKNLPQVAPPDFSSVPLWFPGGVLLKQVESEMTFHVRIPRDAQVQYELEGKGSVEVSAEHITLKKQGPDPAVWKNFRLIPSYARR